MKPLIIATGLALAAASLSLHGAPSEMPGSPKIDPSIVEKADANGLVRVIVTIDFAVAAAQEGGSQCASDACAKLEIANVMLPTEAPVVEMLPGSLMLMEATPAGLDVLRQLPQVVVVVEDGADAPNEGLIGIDAPTGE